MRFKIGDKVRVREDLVLGECYGGDSFIGCMRDLKGKVVTIRSILGMTYRLEEDNCNYNWTDKMLEPISNKECEIEEEEMGNKLIIDLCKKVIEEGEDFIKDGSCDGIRCYEGCPFNNEELDVCDLEYENNRVNVAKKYLKDNGVEIPKQKAKTYKGWEIIKMCEKGEFENGTILIDIYDNCFTVMNGVVLDGEQTEFSSKYETTSSFFIHNKFTVIERKKFDFKEAFEAYEDNIRIESCVDGEIFDKSKEDRGLDRLFNASQIRDKWYIYK